MSVKMFEWAEDQGTELTLQPVMGVDLDADLNEARECQLRLARAEAMAAEAGAGIALLRKIAEAMADYHEGAAPVTFATDTLDSASRALVREVLGRGEVTGRVNDPAPMLIQESVFPGLWRVQSAARPDAPEALIIADVPPMVRYKGGKSLDPTMYIRETAKDVMNALPVLAEIRERAQAYVAERDNHVINFTLLPMCEADMALLRETLGVGHVDLLSKGYGACRVCSTRWPNVWSVQFLNVMDTVILDTLEIGDVPVSVRAAGDDFADSAQRILDIIEAYL